MRGSKLRRLVSHHAVTERDICAQHDSMGNRPARFRECAVVLRVRGFILACSRVYRMDERGSAHDVHEYTGAVEPSFIENGGPCPYRVAGSFVNRFSFSDMLGSIHIVSCMSSHPLTLKYLSQNFAIVLGLVLIWRGIWYVLDWIDLTFLHGEHLWLAVGGIVTGILLLYIPDKNLDELKKL